MKRPSILTLIFIFEFIVLSVSLTTYIPHAASGNISILMDLQAGWSMISLPVLPENGSISVLFSDAVVVYGYQKGVGYVRIHDSEGLEIGKGYWILINSDKTYTLSGESVYSYTLPVEEGWSMIGGCTSSTRVSVENGNIVVIYDYVKKTGYQRLPESGNLEPGKGYWIYITKENSNPLQLILECIDNQSPEISIETPVEGTVYNLTAIDSLIVYDDPEPGTGIDVSTFTATLDGDDISSLYTIGVDQAMTTLTDLSDGDHTLIVSISDHYSNSAFDEATFTVTTIRLSFQVHPGEVFAGQVIEPPLEIAVLDAYDNLITTATNQITVDFYENPSGALLSGQMTVDAIGGVASFPDLGINLTGFNYILKASSPGLSDGLSNEFDVILTAPARVVAEPCDQSIIIEWADVQGATSYHVYQASEIGVNKSNWSTLPDGSHYQDVVSPYIITNLTDNTIKYYFVVTADDGISESTESDEVSSWPLPPDPADIAPPLNGTTETSFVDRIDFLFDDITPVQFDYVPGTFDPDRVAVLRGLVKDKDEAPLGGVEITILNHPEYGRTLTRQNGMFDIVVNGGGLITVKYNKAGFLPVQRHIHAPWEDFTQLADVVMITYDVATEVNLDSPEPFQAARGSIVSDDYGKRQATILFPQGTTATIFLPDGSEQQITNMHVRATEYTGENTGLMAMPAELPETVAFTYAVSLNVDQALEQGIIKNGKEVVFNKPVSFYVENFLNIPVGKEVPAGYYDTERGQWVPGMNSRVIQVAGITDGLAEIDLTGDGSSNGPSDMAAFGITDAERAQIATLYGIGKSFWRARFNHFSTWDINMGRICDPNAACVGGGDAENPPPEPPLCHVEHASTLGAQSSSYGDSYGIDGTSHSLTYETQRTIGYKDNRTIIITLIDGEAPAGLQEVRLEIYVAGRFFSNVFAPSTDLTEIFTWDGYDAYGRLVRVPVTATVRIGYAYKLVYVSKDSPEWGAALSTFGYNGNGEIIGLEPRFMNSGGGNGGLADAILFIIWREFEVKLGGLNAEAADHLGNWTFDRHHACDVDDHTFYTGDGKIERDIYGERLIDTVYYEEFHHTNGIDVGPDGSIYFSEFGADRIRKMEPDGTVITLVAYPDASGLRSIALGQDGSIYYANRNKHTVCRRNTDGSIDIIAGGGTNLYDDFIPATEAQLVWPEWIAVDDDGVVYVTVDHRVRRIGLDGLISTIAGKEYAGYYAGFSGDGGNSTEAQLKYPQGLAIGPDGSLYIADRNNYRIRKVGVDGIITTVAGNGTACWENGTCGDGGPALNAGFTHLRGLDVRPDGSILAVEHSNCVGGNNPGHRVRIITPDGYIYRFAGQGLQGFSGDGGPANQGRFACPMDVAVAPDGSVYITDFSNYRIRKVYYRTSVCTPGTDGFIKMPSEDGSEIYIFNNGGRHLETRDGLTGDLIYEFGYNDSGFLISVTDRDNNVTTIHRDPEGKPTCIENPYGQVTALTLDENDYIDSITNPVNEMHQFINNELGLITTHTDPRNNSYTMSYTTDGYLWKAEDPAGGFYELTRTGDHKHYTVTMKTALGRKSSYEVRHMDDGTIHQTNSGPCGCPITSIVYPDKSRNITYPDGTKVNITAAPDPRWGDLVKYPSNITISTGTTNPITATITTNRIVTLSNPDDPLSLTQQIDTVTINGRTYTSTYDGTANPRTINETTPEGRAMTSSLDTNGRIKEVIIPGIVPIIYSYESRGRIETISQGPNRTYTFTYDSAGYLETVTDPLSNTITLTNDGVGRVTKQIFPDDPNRPNADREIDMSYDDNGNIETITPPPINSPTDPVHTFGYTPVNLEENYFPPDVIDGTHQTHYTYNLDQQLEEVQRPYLSSETPVNQLVDLDYDPTTARLNSITVPRRGKITFGYNSTTGQLTSITTPGMDTTTLTYTYDGALLTETALTGAVQGSVKRSYDSNFNLETFTVNNDDTTKATFVYDNDGLLTTVQLGEPPVDLLTITRDTDNGNEKNGLITGTIMGKITDTIEYNDATQTNYGEVNSYVVKYNGSDLLAINYTRNNTGRITQKTETIGGTTTTYEYFYYKCGWLKEVKKDGSTISTYEYDDNGNRTAYTPNSGTPITGTYDDQDRLIQYGNYTYEYTANGELEKKTDSSTGGITTYTYDALGNLIWVKLPDNTTIDYIIDGQNRRVAKKVDGTIVQKFIYIDQLTPIVELNANNEIVSIFGPGYTIKKNTVYRIIRDHLGSVRLIVEKDNGTIAQRIDYDEYGSIINDTNPGFQPFGFAGGLYDPEMDLTRFGARDYDPVIARWTNKDQIRFYAGNSNLYDYCLNDPINWIDPLGLLTEDVNRAKEILKKCHPEYYNDVATISFVDFEGDTIARTTIWEGNILISRKYAKELNAKQKLDLLETLAHEYQHSNDSVIQRIIDGIYSNSDNLTEHHKQIYRNEESLKREASKAMLGDNDALSSCPCR